MASFTGLKNLGSDVLDYMMRHRPTPDEEMSAGFHDLDGVFPGIYSGKHTYPTYTSPKVDQESMKAIMKAEGDPEALVDIYRAVPKGVRDFNTGDWVTASKSYAKEHGINNLNGDYDIIKTKARAADISEPGDSIAEMGYWGLPVTGKLTRGLIPLFAAGGAGALALAPDDAEAAPAVFANDGRRLKEAFEKATKGELTPDEPDFRFDDAKIPDDAFKTLKKADSRFVTPELGMSEGDVFHVWNDHHNHMDSGQLEDSVDAVLHGADRRATKGNPPWDNGIGAFTGTGKGYNASLRPDSEYTHVYQVNPLDEKRLTRKVVSPSGASDGSEVHPLSIQPENRLDSTASLSVDEAPVEKNLVSDSSDVNKKSAYAAALVPGISDSVPVDDGMLRQFLLGTRGVLEGAGGIADYVRTPLNWLNGKLGGDPEYFKNPGAVLSDSLGLPVPQNETERMRVGFNKGASDALSTAAPGGGIAKYGVGKAAELGKMMSNSPYFDTTIGGLMGLF